MLSKYLDEDYVQKSNEKENIQDLLSNTDLSDESLLKKIFVFVVSSSSYETGSYIWVKDPIVIQQLDPNNPSIKAKDTDGPTFYVHLVGWEISNQYAISMWNDRTYEANVQAIKELLPGASVPYRLDKNEAIRETNDINFLIGEVRKSTNIQINLKLEVWTIYEVFEHIRPTMFVENT